jgi:CBS domain-containing protein
MFVARGMALFAIGARSEAAHRDSERFWLHLAEQLPSIAVWKPKIADQDVEAGRGNHLEGGSHIAHAANLVPLLLKIAGQVSQAIFVVFDNKNSQATWWGPYLVPFGKGLLQARESIFTRIEDRHRGPQRYPRKEIMSKNSAVKRVRKASGQHLKRVKEVASDQPKPLQDKNSLKEAGEKMRSLNTDLLPVACGDRLVGAVEGKFPERQAAGFGHDPETTLVRGIMSQKAYYCFENQSLDEAREIMREHHLQYLPVVDEGMRVIGVVALSDLAAKGRRRKK